MVKSSTRRELLATGVGATLGAATIRLNPYSSEEKELPLRKVDKEKRQAIILNIPIGYSSAINYTTGVMSGGVLGGVVAQISESKITRRKAIALLTTATAATGAGARFFSSIETERRALQNLHGDLTNAGYHVTAVSNGEELYQALNAARRNRDTSANTLLFISAHGGDTNAGPVISLPDGDLQLNMLSRQLSAIPGNVLVAMNSCRAAASYLDEHLNAPGNRVAFMANAGNRETKAHNSLPFFEIIRRGMRRNTENIVDGSLKVNEELKQKLPIIPRLIKKLTSSEFTHFGTREFKL